ncbi:endoplasmic oxidoreductin [Epithele typhae]|uniref:endoplasmic oxidoreductin n=1 Tax=Epithele typhae TaxID=378194 RepID=UPI00200890F6|nr:endoplasmic oxidoreductin [Epithele typhae]KAH9931060.1 endoplasmic oxidoreductin [Epithele typhae]
MLSRSVYALLFASLLDPLVASADASGSQETFLGEGAGRSPQVKSVLEHEPASDPSCKQFPTGPIEMTQCDFETMESVADTLYEEVHALVETPFFKYFRADLYRDCPYWQENGLCMNRECGITTVDESEIPENWRAAALSKVQRGDQRTQLPGCYYRDSDFCFLDDETEGDYIDLTLNPERFTGYTGPSAHRVWTAIYEENCFGMSELGLMKAPNPAPVSLPDDMTEALRGEDTGSQKVEQCLERRVYYKVVSGLHASISTHICHEDMNQTTGEWGPNLECFISRVAAHPERMEYMYFDAILLLRAVARLGPYLSAYDYCGTGAHEDDTETIERLTKVIDIARAVGRFDESVLFRGENANVLKQEFKEHFRNVTRIMDCVGCDKCRLWGKVQTTGIATALKVLFELDEKALDPKANVNLLQRSELVALMNTLHRLVESLHVVQNFRRMWSEANADEEARLLEVARSAINKVPKATHPPPAGQAGAPQDMFSDVLEKLAFWVRACRDGTIECVQGVLDVLSGVVEAVTSVFRLSGKDQGPGRSDL